MAGDDMSPDVGPAMNSAADSGASIADKGIGELVYRFLLS